jgi:Tfp pilus assembly protein PilN
MVKQLKNIINEAQKFYILGVSLSNDKEDFLLLEVLYREEGLTILKKSNFSTIDDSTIKYIKKDYPIVLHIDGDSIISKDVQNNVGYRKNLIFKSNPEEFCFYEYHQDNKVFASFTRKETLIRVLTKLNEFDKYVVHICLGPFVLVNLSLVLKNESLLASNQYKIKIKDSFIESYEKSDQSNYNYEVGDESINKSETVLLASLIDYLYPNQNIKIDTEYLNFNREQQKYKRYFKLSGVVVLISILLALFISHFMLQNNLKELAEKESIVSISNQTLNQLNNLKEERILKEKVLVSSGVIDKNYAVKYLNDIGKSIPHNISLDKIRVKKPTKKIKPNEKVSFDLNSIEIEGYSNDDNAFNNWYKSLKHLDWVKQSEIVKYREDSKSKNYFLILITL